MSAEKTEEPTPRRLKKAEEDGDAGISAFLAQWLGFLVGVALLPAAAFALFSYGKAAILAALRGDPRPASSVDLALTVLSLSIPLLVAVAASSAIASKVQGGSGFTFRALTPKGERLDPIRGLSNLVTGARLFAVVRSLVLALGVATFAWVAMREHVRDLAHGFGDPSRISVWAGARSREILIRVALLGLFFGFVDLLVVRIGWKKRLRMSRAEVKREHREQEGDPQQKAARERAHHELLASVAIANVRKASVLVVNPTHLATALRYDQGEGDETPLVLASGAGDLAARMIEEARRYAVPIVRDVPLAHALSAIESGETIPEVLYEAVAAVLEEAWNMEGEKAPDTSPAR